MTQILSLASSTSGSAAGYGELQKHTINDQARVLTGNGSHNSISCRSLWMLGRGEGGGDEALTVLNRVARRLAIQHNTSASETLNDIYIRLSIVL